MDRCEEGPVWAHVYKRGPLTRITRFDQKEHLRLEEILQLADLQLLEKAFANHSLLEEQEGQHPKRKYWQKRPQPSRQQPGNLTLSEFQAVLSELLGSETWNNQMEGLFNKVDTSCDGFVDWSEFCTFMLLQYREKDYVKARKETFAGQQPTIRLCLQNKQEPMSRILAISSPPPLWFVTVSKGGILTAWDSNLHIQKSYEIAADTSNSQAGKRRFKSWTTDAVYMANVHKIAVTTTSRDIHFFDVSTMNIFEEFHLFALNNVPTTLYYWYNAKSPGSSSLMVWGDDHGALHLLWLHRPHSGIFEKPFTQQPGPQKVFMQDLKDHSELLSYETIPDVHPEAITKVLYIRERDLLITSSSSEKTSVVIMDIHRKGKAYTWRINKGVRCFDYCGSLNLLVTGGVDHRVCLWNQYVTSRPIAVFQEHNMGILDVVIYEPRGQIFSYSKDSVLKVWDIVSHTCLQTLVLRFPCVQPGRMLDQGDFPFLLVREPLHLLLVSYADYIGMLRLVHTTPGDEIIVTHDAPLCGALYNAFFHQVVTGSEDSIITVWDIETGAKYLLLNNAHGNEAITCMAFDSSCRKLVTGARNGTAKVWNIQNGHNLHRLEAVEDAEITGVIPLRDFTFLTVGWSRKMLTYDISQTENLHVAADRSWKGGQLHTEDILAADYCSSLALLATASFDGEIIVWNTETQRLYLYLRKAQPSRVPSQRRSVGPRSSAAQRAISHSHRGSRYSSDTWAHPPVDKLLFLPHRCSDRALNDSAILVSSEAGMLSWWSVSGEPHRFACFYAPREADESVFGLSTNLDDTVLVSGDTGGLIQVWDISGYGLHPADQGSARWPPLLYSWRAHASTVVSVEQIRFESDSFILSGSSDRTARLWTSDGKCVGTFGQEKSWNLKNPTTFLHPKDPWGEMTFAKIEKPPVKQQTFADWGVSNAAELAKNMEVTEGRVNQDRTNEKTAKEPKEPPLTIQLKSNRESVMNLDPPVNAASGMKPVLPTPPRNSTQTKQENILGHRVEEDLLRRREFRRERRGMFGEVNVSKFCRFGKLCSPFQALQTPDVEKVALPRGLPMSPWMLSQGMACTTESDLRTLHLTATDPEWENPEEAKTQPQKDSAAYASKNSSTSSPDKNSNCQHRTVKKGQQSVPSQACPGAGLHLRPIRWLNF